VPLLRVDLPQFSGEPHFIDASYLIEQNTRRLAVEHQFRTTTQGLALARDGGHDHGQETVNKTVAPGREGAENWLVQAKVGINF
jgi:hypothetical protein